MDKAKYYEGALQMVQRMIGDSKSSDEIFEYIKMVLNSGKSDGNK